MCSVASHFSKKNKKNPRATSLDVLMQLKFFSMHRCCGGILARQCFLYYPQQLLTVKIKSIYLFSKPCTVVQDENLGPDVSPGCRIKSFSLNE